MDPKYKFYCAMDELSKSENQKIENRVISALRIQFKVWHLRWHLSLKFLVKNRDWSVKYSSGSGKILNLASKSKRDETKSVEFGFGFMTARKNWYKATIL